MTKRTRLGMMLLAAASPALTGCMPKMTIEELKASLPQRPPELDKLDCFVGEWESTGEVKLSGVDRTLEFSGTNRYTWENDNWCLVERGEYELEEFGKVQMMGLWAYDMSAKEYRYFGCSSVGEIVQGVEEYDETTQTWKLKGKYRSASGTTSERCTMKLVDDDTIEWACTARAFLGLFKVGDSKGTLRRK